MSEKSLDQLVKSSTKAASEQLQHLLVMLTPDGRLRLNGTDNFVNALYGDVELLDRIEILIKSNRKGGWRSEFSIFAGLSSSAVLSIFRRVEENWIKAN